MARNVRHLKQSDIRDPLPKTRRFTTKGGSVYEVTRVKEGVSVFDTPRGQRLVQLFEEGKDRRAPRGGRKGKRK